MSLRGTFSNGNTSAPIMYYEISYSETGRNGSSATYSVTVKPYLKTGHWYGYNINGTVNINGATQTKQLWSTSGSGTTQTFTITASAGAGGGTLPASFSATGSGDSSCNISVTGKTVSLSTFNTAPTAPGTITADGTTGNKTIPENQGSIALSWGASTDANGNFSYYRVRVSINGGGYTEIGRPTTNSMTHNVADYVEGTSFKYVVDAFDSYGAGSANSPYSGLITKNVMSNGGFTSHSNDVSFDTASFTLNFTRGTNTNGAVTYMKCYSDNVTVYNQTEITTGTSQTILIWRTNDATPAANQPYIKFDDLKNYFAGSAYNGRLHVGLQTRNDTGGAKWAGGSIGVDLRTNPNPVTGQVISTVNNGTVGTESTIYKKVASNTNFYFIPNGTGVARVKWSVGSGKLGEDVDYEVYAAYGAGGWTKIADITDAATTYYNHVIPTQTVSQDIKYLVRTKTSYGYYSDAQTPAVTLHYYNKPTITRGTITRGATTADVKVTVKTNSSIPNINTAGSWIRVAPGTTTPTQQSGTLAIAQTEQNIALTGLTDTGTYDLRVTYNDNTGFATNQVEVIGIGQNSPLFFVNRYGVGVNGNKADANTALNVKGAAAISDKLAVVKNNVYDSNLYSTGNIELRTTDGTYPSIGFHRAGSSGVALLSKGYGSDSLWIKNADGAEGRVWTSLNFNPSNYLPSSGGYMAGSINFAVAAGARTIYNTNNANDAICLASHGNDTWFRSANNVWTFQGGNYGDDWTRTFQISSSQKGYDLPVSTNADWVYFGQMASNSPNGSHRGVAIRKYQGGTHVRGDLDVGQIYCDAINSLPIEGWSGRRYSIIPTVNSAGVMEIGTYIDFHTSSGDTSDYTSRIQGMTDGTIATNSSILCGYNNNASIVGFYAGTVRVGYVGKPSSSSNDIAIVAENSSTVISHGHFVPNVTRGFWLGTNSPDRQWKGVCCEGGVVGASDAKSKENMVRLDGSRVILDEENNILQEFQPFSMLSTIEQPQRAIPSDYYEFIRDRFKPTYYNYKLTGIVNKDTGEEVIPAEDEYNMLKNVGFVAQDYDLETDKVAREFIIKNGDGNLQYNHMSYVTVGIIALQETIKELELVKQENQQLKTDLALIKEKLGL